jgi:hypothetical protein
MMAYSTWYCFVSGFCPYYKEKRTLRKLYLFPSSGESVGKNIHSLVRYKGLTQSLDYTFTCGRKEIQFSKRYIFF